MYTALNITPIPLTLDEDFPVTYSDGGVFVVQIDTRALLAGEELHVTLSVVDVDDVWAPAYEHDIVADTDPPIWTSPPQPAQYNIRATMLQHIGAGTLVYPIIFWRLDVIT